MPTELIQMAVLEGDETAWRGMRVKLTCGCWSDWHHAAAEMWAFPDLAHRCHNGHGERQFDLHVQMLLMEEQS
jgi:hypothetical protein